MYTLRVNVQGPSNPNSNQGYSAIFNRVVLYVYSIIIFDADVSSFLNKPLHGVLIPFSSCSVQGSSLIVGKRKRSHKINWSECMNDFKCNRQSKCLNLMMDSKSFLLQFDWRLDTISVTSELPSFPYIGLMIYRALSRIQVWERG